MPPFVKSSEIKGISCIIIALFNKAGKKHSAIENIVSFQLGLELLENGIVEAYLS